MQIGPLLPTGAAMRPRRRSGASGMQRRTAKAACRRSTSPPSISPKPQSISPWDASNIAESTTDTILERTLRSRLATTHRHLTFWNDGILHQAGDGCKSRGRRSQPTGLLRFCLRFGWPLTAIGYDRGFGLGNLPCNIDRRLVPSLLLRNRPRRCEPGVARPRGRESGAGEDWLARAAARGGQRLRLARGQGGRFPACGGASTADRPCSLSAPSSSPGASSAHGTSSWKQRRTGPQTTTADPLKP